MADESKPQPEFDRAKNRSEIPDDDEIDAALDRLIAKGTSSPTQDADELVNGEDDPS